jgi:hypothetical protein
MFNPISSSDLSYSQTKNIIEEFSHLKDNKGAGYWSLSVKPTFYNPAREKIQNLLAMHYEWSPELKHLPDITKKVVQFIKTQEGEKINGDSLIDAINGIAVLKTIELNSNDNLFVEESIDHLLECESLIGDEMECKPSASMYYTSKIWPYLSIVGSMKNKISSYMYPNEILSFQTYKNLDFSEEENFSFVNNVVKKFIHFNREENSLELRDKIKLKLVEILNNAQKIQVSENCVEVPLEFYHFFPQLKTICMNKKTADLDETESSAYQNFFTVLSNQFESPLSQRLIAMLPLLGVDDQIESWYLENWPISWEKSKSPFIFISPEEGYHIQVTRKGEGIEIKAKIILKIGVHRQDKKNTQPEDESISFTDGNFDKMIRNDLKKTLFTDMDFCNDFNHSEAGYFVIERELIVKKNELQKKLENLGFADLLPSLCVNQTVSDFYPTLEEAKHFFNNTQSSKVQEIIHRVYNKKT